MREIHDIRVIKGTGQSAIEVIELVVMTGIMFYMLRPDLRIKHTTAVRAKIRVMAYWISVQHTLTSIRNLPETGQM